MPHVMMTDMQSAALLDDWTFEEDKTLEAVLAEFWGAPDRINRIVAKLPKRDAAAVRDRLSVLEEDISNIEAGLIPLPEYPADTLAHHIATSAPHSHHQHPVFGTPVTAGPTPPPRPTASAGGGGAAASAGVPSSAGAGGHTTAAAPASGVEPRKGVPWSEEEHRLFLLGLAKFGKGDWRSISRHFVVSRTPTQVASHAQKYFIRLTNASKKEKRRSSIHDMTSPGGSGGSGDAPVGDGRMPPDVQRAMQADLAAAGVSAPAAAAAALAAAQGMPLAAATVAGYAG